MIIRFSVLNEDNKYVARSINECKNDTDKQLWKIHESIPDRLWSCGKTFAERIDNAIDL